MKDKGFTLIELIAVIIILGVIALIGVKVVAPIIEESKEKAFEATSANYLKELEVECSIKKIKGENYILDINVLDGIYNTTDTISVKGSMPYKVLMQTNDECSVALALYNDELETCAYKKMNDEKIRYVKTSKVSKCILNVDVRPDGDEPGGYLSTESDKINITPVECFEFNKSSFYITGYDESCPKDVVIPYEIDGVKVIGIKSNAMRDKGLTSVIMPETITHIGQLAFANNDISYVGFGEGLKQIESGAFYNNKITEVIFPDSLKKVVGSSDIAIFNKNPLVRVVFGTGIEVIDQSAFVSSTDLEEVDLSFANSLTTIGQSAFYGSNISNFEIPESVETIGQKAFQNSKLKEITIPSSVATIGAKAFNTTSLKKIYIRGKESLDEFESLGDAWYNSNKTILEFVD